MFLPSTFDRVAKRKPLTHTLDNSKGADARWLDPAMAWGSNGIEDDPISQLVAGSSGGGPQHGEIQSECSPTDMGHIMEFLLTRYDADVGPTASDAESAEDGRNTENNPTN